jgi:hypothetical protein
MPSGWRICSRSTSSTPAYWRKRTKAARLSGHHPQLQPVPHRLRIPSLRKCRAVLRQPCCFMCRNERHWGISIGLALVAVPSLQTGCRTRVRLTPACSRDAPVVCTGCDVFSTGVGVQPISRTRMRACATSPWVARRAQTKPKLTPHSTAPARAQQKSKGTRQRARFASL